jgi:hypothetical protein
MKKGKKTGLSDKRYESVMKRLDLRKAKGSKRKFLIIQIDSLPYSTIKRFIDKGSCKFTKSLLEKKGYHMQRFNCGFPSGTPSVQAGIMYGDNSMLPGFRFVDKKNKKSISFGNPNNARYVEEKFFSKKKGILKGGSSYSNHFSGDASRSILTMSTITKTKRLKRVKESNLWLFLFLHPASALRVLYYTFAEMLIEAGEMLTHPFMRLFGKKKIIMGFRIPIRRFLMNVILAEIITIGVILDIKRKVPKIFINYMNYDDIAHLRGPNSTAAYFMVRALDRRIKRICNKIKDDEYDIFIMSDHGQVPSVPFREANGMTLAQFIGKCARVKSFGLTSAHEGRLSIIGILMKKTLGFMKYVSTPLRWTGTAFAKGMIKALKPKKYRFVWDKKEAIFVLDSCSLAHVYFSISKERMDLKQIIRKYPNLVKKILRNKGIGIVMAKKGNDIVLLNRKGRLTIRKDSVRQEGRDFLQDYGDKDVLIKQLRDYNKRVKFIGDLVIFGHYKDGNGISFTEHVGAHGGIGGDMMYSFFISKEKLDLSKVWRSDQLHKIFKDY